ncbi:hypothetical protein C0Q70_04585 [Pomacea canaliculata]|uniref:Uncharacterized protein n=1 Tax=Pomacea canaliculata TaxID=400727 RepID=A0A2T7PIS8_POMCA|nr:hypothetical protein C0Q70_04585 [Pomacea canaliculata]
MPPCQRLRQKIWCIKEQNLGEGLLRRRREDMAVKDHRSLSRFGPRPGCGNCDMVPRVECINQLVMDPTPPTSPQNGVWLTRPPSSTATFNG